MLTSDQTARPLSKSGTIVGIQSKNLTSGLNPTEKGGRRRSTRRRGGQARPGLACRAPSFTRQATRGYRGADAGLRARVGRLRSEEFDRPNRRESHEWIRATTPEEQVGRCTSARGRRRRRRCVMPPSLAMTRTYPRRPRATAWPPPRPPPSRPPAQPLPTTHETRVRDMDASSHLRAWGVPPWSRD